MVAPDLPNLPNPPNSPALPGPPWSDVPDRPMVSNTSPLINLAGVGLLELLPQLYGTIWIPGAVSREYTAGRRAGEPSLDSLSWIRTNLSVAVQPHLPPGLGAGESETISLAIIENARAILLDEQIARSAASKMGLRVVGTLAVLVAAKQSGLLEAVKPVLDNMVAQGRHISEQLYTRILVAVGEVEEISDQ